MPLDPLKLWPRSIQMENDQKHQSHKQSEAETIVDRIEKKDAANEAANEAARQAETKRTLDDYGKKVGS